MLLREAVTELTRLKIYSEPCALIQADILRMLQKLTDDLYASNSMAALATFNEDRQNQSILVKLHLSARISSDFYAKLLINAEEIANVLKTSTHESIVTDYLTINSVKMDVIQRWEEARQEQKKIVVDGKTKCLAMEIDRLNNVANGVHRCRQKVDFFHVNKIKTLKHQIDHWKCLRKKEFDELNSQISEGEYQLENLIKQTIEIDVMIETRQKVINNFNSIHEIEKEIIN